MQPADGTTMRGGDLNHGLVGLHFGHGLVLFDPLAFRHQPSAQLDLGNPFTQIGEFEFIVHAQYLMTFSMAVRICSVVGK